MSGRLLLFMRVLADCFGVGKFGVAVDAERAAYWRSRLDAHLARYPEDRRHHETASDAGRGCHPAENAKTD